MGREGQQLVAGILVGRSRPLRRAGGRRRPGRCVPAARRGPGRPGRPPSAGRRRPGPRAVRPGPAARAGRPSARSGSRPGPSSSTAPASPRSAPAAAPRRRRGAGRSPGPGPARPGRPRRRAGRPGPAATRGGRGRPPPAGRTGRGPASPGTPGRGRRGRRRPGRRRPCRCRGASGGRACGRPPASAGPPAVASRTSRSVNASQPTSRVWGPAGRGPPVDQERLPPLDLAGRFERAGVDRHQVDVGQRPRLATADAAADDQPADTGDRTQVGHGFGEPLVQQLTPAPARLHAVIVQAQATRPSSEGVTRPTWRGTTRTV